MVDMMFYLFVASQIKNMLFVTYMAFADTAGSQKWYLPKNTKHTVLFVCVSVFSHFHDFPKLFSFSGSYAVSCQSSDFLFSELMVV